MIRDVLMTMRVHSYIVSSRKE
uniref:Uncharacterized protein n=1 Tax=Lepeophtheirus salmonis TaxID=72036 RepID=A0A0K2V1T4_LEPSM